MPCAHRRLIVQLRCVGEACPTAWLGTFAMQRRSLGRRQLLQSSRGSLAQERGRCVRGIMSSDDAQHILRLNKVLDRTGLSRSTLYRKMERGTFPKQVRISERCVGWRETDVEGWLRNPMYYEHVD